MENKFILILVLLLAAGTCFAKCGSVTPGHDHLANFTCYVGEYSDCTHGEGKNTCFEYVAKRNISITLKSTYVIAAPECSINDARVADSSSGSKNKIDKNKVIAICRQVLLKTNYITLPYGFDRIGPNRVNSSRYSTCVYTQDGQTWIKSHGWLDSFSDCLPISAKN